MQESLIGYSRRIPVDLLDVKLNPSGCIDFVGCGDKCCNICSRVLIAWGPKAAVVVFIAHDVEHIWDEYLWV